MPNYRIGELDQQITIHRQSTTPDGRGGFTRTETLLHTVFAHVMPRGGGEVFKYEKQEAPAGYTFVIRYHSGLGIREDDLIKWDGDSYNIRSIPKRSTRKMYLEIEAEREVAQ